MRLHNEEIKTLGINNNKIYVAGLGKIFIISINNDYKINIEKIINTNISSIKSYCPEFNIFGSSNGYIFKVDNNFEKKLINDFIACFAKLGKFIVTASWDKTLRIWDQEFNEKYKYEDDILIWCMKGININLKYYDYETKISCLLVCDYNGKFHVFLNNKLIFSIKIHYSCIRSFDLLTEINYEIKEFYDKNRLEENIIKIIKTIKIVSISNVGQVLIHTLESIYKHIDIKTISFKVLLTENNICCLCDENTIFLFNNKLENKKILYSNNSTIWDGVIYNSNIIIIGGSNGYLEIIDIKNKKLISSLKEEEEIIEYEHYTLKGNKIYSKTGEYIGEKLHKESAKQFIDLPPERKQFSIEVGNQNLPINFMTDENPNVVASRFLINHNLDMGYQSEIVSFINKHFKKHTKDFLGIELILGINIEALEKKLKDFDSSIIIELLARCNKNELKRIEMYKDLDDDNVIQYSFSILKEIYDKLEPGNKYFIIEIIRYLVLFEGINIDFLYFTDLYNEFLNIKSDKELTSLLRLVINLYPRKFLNMEIFYKFFKSKNILSQTYEKYLFLRDKVLLESS